MVPAAKILATAREQKADAIGLSGLITPSLDEMVHVAQELEREGFELPLLIGGATTSRAHTAVKIAQHYSSPTIHVTDASRAVGVVGSLLSLESRAAFSKQTRADYDRLREDYANKTREKKLLSLADARANKPQFDWPSYTPPQPKRIGEPIVATPHAGGAARVRRLVAVLSCLGVARKISSHFRRSCGRRAGPRTF